MAASPNILCFLRNVRLLLKDIKKICATASGNILCFLRNVRLLLKDIKKICATASGNILFFKERAAASGSKCAFKHVLRKNVQKYEFLEKYRFKLIFEVNMNTVNV